MAKITLGKTTEKLTGSIGEITYGTWGQTKIAKKKIKREDKNSSSQQMQRSFVNVCINIWHCLAPVVKREYEGLLSNKNYTQYNCYLHNNISKIKNGSPGTIAQRRTMPELTLLNSYRPEYGHITYIEFNPADISGDECIQLIIYEVGKYGKEVIITTAEISAEETSPKSIYGLADSGQYHCISYKTNNRLSAATDYSNQRCTTWYGVEMSTPIGSIQAWHKNMPGCPALPPEWLECNGQEIIDEDSPLNGQLTPAMNGGSNGYIKGAETSGVSVEQQALAGVYTGLILGNHAHTKGSLAVTAHPVHNHEAISGDGLIITAHAEHRHYDNTRGTNAAASHAHDMGHAHGTIAAAHNAAGTSATTHAAHNHLAGSKPYPPEAGINMQVYDLSMANYTELTVITPHGTHNHNVAIPAYIGNTGGDGGHAHDIAGHWGEVNNIPPHNISGTTKNNSATQTHAVTGTPGTGGAGQGIIITGGGDELMPNSMTMVWIIRIK